jgi:membrane protein YqaA with SNARE-associated domain
VTEWLDWFSRYAFEGGIGGLFALSVIDSAGVPTGGGPDVVITLLASLNPDPSFAAALAAAAAIGSVIGCLALYWIGLRGGSAGAQRFAPNAVAKARQNLERHGAWVVFLAVLAPPPIPTKLFVFCAGIAAVSIPRFVVATMLGRALRYGAGAVLAVHYGPQALDILRASTSAALWYLALPLSLGVIGLAVSLWRRRAVHGQDA